MRIGHTTFSAMRGRVWRGALESRRYEEGTNGVAGQGVNIGSLVFHTISPLRKSSALPLSPSHDRSVTSKRKEAFPPIP